MALVSLPEFLHGRPATSTDAKMVQDALHNDYNVECPVKCVGGKLYVRISAHVYNEPASLTTLSHHTFLPQICSRTPMGCFSPP